MLSIPKLAQATSEYAILISLVIAACVGIQNEVRRGLQGRIHNELLQLTQDFYEPSSGIKRTTDQQSHKDTTENYSQGNQNEDWTTTHDNSSAKYTLHKKE